MDKYKDFLAAEILSESQVVSYRALSRALKVHVDIAKQMLFDFHQTQNARKPGALHATYLITGRKPPQPSSQTSNGVHKDGEDTVQPSSPFMSSFAEKDEPMEEAPRSILTVTLVAEEKVEEAKSQFEELQSVQIYSLEPGPMSDLHILVHCNQEMAAKATKDDPLQRWKVYGSIQNQNVKRRILQKGLHTPTVAAKERPPAPKPLKVETKQEEAAKQDFPRKQAGAHAGPVGELKSEGVAAAASEPSTKMTKKPTLKKEGSSDLFKAFAKAKPIQPKPKSAEAPHVPESQDQSGQEDEEMEDASDGENEEQAAAKRKAAEDERRQKAEREEELRKMMEDDDDDDDIMEDVMEEAEANQNMVDAPPAKAEEPQKEEFVTVSEGRRRGRRRVMKKKTMKDEEGYLVTKEEAVWESFSEDEPVLKKPKPAPVSAKGKKGGKPGQGSIMNFFQKK